MDGTLERGQREKASFTASLAENEIFVELRVR